MINALRAIICAMLYSTERLVEHLIIFKTAEKECSVSTLISNKEILSPDVYLLMDSVSLSIH